MKDTDLIEMLVDQWRVERDWAEKLLVATLGLDSAEEVLQRRFRGKHIIPGTEWSYRTHGYGVDITKEGNRGGIDFDFNRPEPDAWRLRVFLVKQYNDGALTKKHFRPLLQDQQRWDAAVSKVLSP